MKTQMLEVFLDLQRKKFCCCRRQGIDPHAWMTDILARLPQSTTRDIPSLTPRAWANARHQHQSDTQLLAA